MEEEKAKAGEGAVWPARYSLLDAFRGMAALAVVAFHAQFCWWGHYGVPVFFVISGYCIYASAEAVKTRGVGAGEFMRHRILRIYPPYVLALLFFLATRLVKWKMTGENQLAQYTLVDYVQNLTLTQWTRTLVGGDPPFMVAAFWSLNYEVQFYAVVGLCLAVARWHEKLDMQRQVLGLLAVSMVWCMVFEVPRYAWFLECWPMFGLGCVAYLYLCRWRSGVARRSAEVFVGMVLVAALLGLWRGVRVFGGLTESLAAGAGFTLVLMLLRPCSDRVAGWLPVRWIGAVGVISYSLYLIHQFNLVLVGKVVGLVMPGGGPRVLEVLLILMGHVVLAAVFWRFCERPFLRK